ncbi:MAG: high-affinity branched-chain amino acid ABC transporter permease LivM [Candidatus Eiseniibacteriota bacterium]
MLKEAAGTALVVFALAVGLVGVGTYDVPGGIAYRLRFDDVAVAVVLAFAARIVMALLRAGRATPVFIVAGLFTLALLVIENSVTLFGPDAGAEIKRFAPFHSPVLVWVVLLAGFVFTVRAGRLIWLAESSAETAQSDAALDSLVLRIREAAPYVGPLLILFAIALPFMPFADRRIIDIAILVLTYVMLGWGLNIVVGLAGLLDLGYVAFYAVGAYSYALLGLHFGFGFWLCLPFAGLMAASAGLTLGFPVLRLRGDYLAIVTLGFGEMIRIILLNWQSLTKGPNGISGIPRPSFFGLSFEETVQGGARTSEFHQYFGLPYATVDKFIFLYYLILALALLTNLFTLRVRKLPIGRAWEALREDEIACRSLGINPTNTKLTAFALGAMFGGIAGSFFATRQTFISPESFTFIESAVILAIVVLGGFGSQIGVVLAAVILVGLPEFFRDLAQYRMLAFGAAMVTIMLWRPAGLLAHREPTLRLNPRPGSRSSG